MARPPRLELAGGLYHVTARGNERRALYRDAEDRCRQLEVLASVVERFHWICLAYCQMGNHYHLLIRTPIPNLARGMRQLNGHYAQAFNARHRRSGHLFQGRYKAILVQDDAHAINAAAYTLRNPLAAKLCTHAELWPWSSYRATLGLEPQPHFLNADALLLLFGTSRDRARAALREQIEQSTPAPARPEPPGSILLGDAEFTRQHTTLIEPHPEYPRTSWRPQPPPLADLLSDPTSDASLLAAYRDHGYALREIGDQLGLHYTTISRRLRHAEHREAQRKT
jgi:REP element-mobilizing transposase RayT